MSAMTPERWREVDALVKATLERAPSERAAYVTQACGMDEELKREVESLLAAAVEDDFLERSPFLPPGDDPPTIARLTAALGASYEVERELGRGGMAAVYLAHDRRQRRVVAIKVLHPELSAVLGPRRFLREIELTASLQHPHILPLFESGSADGLLYYVMPYVAGETLRERLVREQQLSIEVAVRIAREVADALEYAHRHGIIHRDVKPENILLGEDGHAMLSDFGIALAVSNAAGARITRTGLSLGTPQYMAPEQAGGRPVDARTDVYALGCVLYEMLAGEPPFTGPTAQAIIVRLLSETPRPLAAQRASVPEHVDAAVRVAIEKLPADRFTSARAFADALANPGAPLPARAVTTSGATNAAVAMAANERPASRGNRAMRWLPWALAPLAAAAAWLVTRPRADTAAEPVRFTIASSNSGDLFDGDAGVSVAISRDGRLVAYTGKTASGRQLLLRPLASLRASALPRSNEALPPFFSPDGHWLAFGQLGQLRKLSIAGGEPVTVADVAQVGSWSPRGTIVLSGDFGTGLRTVTAEGSVKPLTRPDTAGGAHWHRMPLALSDSETVLFADYPASGSSVGARIGIASLSTGAARTLGVEGIAPLGIVDGRLAFVAPDRRIMGVPLDLATRRVAGDPVPLVEQVLVGANGLVAAALAENGTLVYVRGAQSGAIVLEGIDGRQDSIAAGTRIYAFPRFSPDGRRLAVAATEGTTQEIWVFDIAAGTSSRLTAMGTADRPEWTPDGRRIAWIAGQPDGSSDVWWQPADGSGSAERLATMTNPVREVSFSPDGRFAILRDDTPRKQRHLWLVPLDGERTPRPLLVSDFDATSARVSPDGRWLAYVSNESGQNEVYVRRFSQGGGRWVVSSAGGSEPVWARDGRSLFYRSGRTLVRVAVGPTSSFAMGRRDTLSREMVRENYRSSYFHAMYDVSPDGRRFAFAESGSEAPELIAVLHFDAELRARVPSAGSSAHR
jgi:serine/threonine protein kinase/Tol biopolymer transport system component